MLISVMSQSFAPWYLSHTSLSLSLIPLGYQLYFHQEMDAM